MTLTRLHWRGQVFRACSPLWSYDPSSGSGASKVGGRFNPKGIPAHYASLDATTAVIECQQGFARRVQPYTMVAYAVDCKDVVDLTTDAGRREVDMTLEAMSCPWLRLQYERKEVPTQTLARRLIAEDVAGALVPSFAPGAAEHAVNVVFWNWGPDKPHRVAVIDDHDRLPSA